MHILVCNGRGRVLKQQRYHNFPHQNESICIFCCRVLSEQEERFSYFASVGVNTYVTVQLSFLPESERRCTRIAARTFSPEFDHHIEVSCDLLVQQSSGETCSLAELLEDASAVFTVWNRDSRKGLSLLCLIQDYYR